MPLTNRKRGATIVSFPETSTTRKVKMASMQSSYGNMYRVPELTREHRLSAVVAYLVVPARRTFEGQAGSTSARSRLVTLTMSSGRVGFPGGFVDRNDASPWEALRREWFEETGSFLSRTVELACWLVEERRGPTGIYLLGLSDDADPNEIYFNEKKSDGEAKAMVWRSLEEMRRGVQGREKWSLRDCAVHSTRVILDWLEEEGFR